jgi:hypothetical protein
VQVLLGSGRIPVARQWQIIDAWIDIMAEGRIGRPVARAGKTG